MNYHTRVHWVGTVSIVSPVIALILIGPVKVRQAPTSAQTPAGLVGPGGVQPRGGNPLMSGAGSQPSQPQIVQAYGKLPLSFEENQGQTDQQVKFLSRGSGYALFLTGNEAVLSLKKPGSAHLFSTSFGRLAGAEQLNAKPTLPDFPRLFVSPAMEFEHSMFRSRQSGTVADNGPRTAGAVLRMKLVGGNTVAKTVGLDELPGKSNYFIGNDPKKWRTDVPNYAKVKYANVYPGVDLVYYGNQRQLEYDFVVAPGADPNQIALDVAPASSRHAAETTPLRIDGNGDLVVQTETGELRFHKPVVYQPSSNSGLRASDQTIEGKYVLVYCNIN